MAQAIAAHGLAFGGGGYNNRPTGVIEVGAITAPIEARLPLIRIAANGGLCRPRPRGALLCRPIESGRVALAVARDPGGGML
jgi:hypothetical protein